MNSINFLLLFLLIFALVLSLFKTGKNARIARAFRILITFLGILFFGYWFFQKSLNNFLEKSMSVQVINRLNQPIDFYAIKVINKDNNQFLSKHLGKIRTNHYQIEYFDMSNSNEYWVIGYLPKSKMVYFTQHSVQNKEADQKIEVKNYLNQSVKLSEKAQEVVDNLKLGNIGQSVKVTLTLLLLFLNIVLLTRKESYSH
jgi:5-enolpyruvylshikimate-3-phosphate synthase